MKRGIAKRKATRIEQKERKRTVVVGDFCFWRGERPEGSGERKSPGSSTVFCTGPSSGFPADIHAKQSIQTQTHSIQTGGFQEKGLGVLTPAAAAVSGA